MLFCPAPPTAHTNVRVTSRTATTITVGWGAPTRTGRDDYFCQVLVSDPTNRAVFTEVGNYTGTMHHITGLTPFTSYTIRVISHNGVSDQDPQGASSRQVEIFNMTLEDGEIHDAAVRGGIVPVVLGCASWLSMGKGLMGCVSYVNFVVQ